MSSAQLDEIPEQAFYMVGAIDDVLERGKRAGHEAKEEALEEVASPEA